MSTNFPVDLNSFKKRMFTVLLKEMLSITDQYREVLTEGLQKLDQIEGEFSDEEILGAINQFDFNERIQGLYNKLLQQTITEFAFAMKPSDQKDH